MLNAQLGALVGVSLSVGPVGRFQVSGPRLEAAAQREEQTAEDRYDQDVQAWSFGLHLQSHLQRPQATLHVGLDRVG